MEKIQSWRGLPAESIIERATPEDSFLLAKAYAQYRGLNFIGTLEEAERLINPEDIRLLSQSVINNLKVFPLRVDRGKLIVLAPHVGLSIKEGVNQRASHPVEFWIAPKTIIEQLIISYIQLRKHVERVSQEISTLNVPRTDEKPKDEEQSNYNLFLNYLTEALNMRASDIHFEPRRIAPNAFQGLIRFRVDGKLVPSKLAIDKEEVYNALISTIKLTARLDIAEKRRPQDGRISIDRKDLNLNLRVATSGTIHGEQVVIRILPKEGDLKTLDRLDFRKDLEEEVRKAINSPYGLILVTGPTGSGKSTTLAAFVYEIAKRGDLKVLSVEDPVEYTIPGVQQHQVNPEAGITFPRVLRAFLRQDPDVIYVGEIRDSETAKIATEAALTGHLVFGTLHTNDAPSAVSRLLQMGVESYNLAPALRAIMAQRLVRRVCPSCARPLNDEERRELSFHLRAAGMDDPTFLEAHELSLKNARIGTGCQRCRYSGYQGRIPIHEWMEKDPQIEELIVNKAPVQVIQESAIRQGMLTLFQDGLIKVLQGLTTVREIVPYAPTGSQSRTEEDEEVENVLTKN